MQEKSRRIYLLPVVCATVFLFLFSAVCSAQNSRKTENGRGVAAPKQQEYRQPEHNFGTLSWDELPPEVRRYVKSFRQQHSLYREMPRMGFNCDKEMFCFLKQHPDLVIGFWEVLGVTEISLKEIKENRFRMVETGGTTANVHILYQTPEISIVYGKGEFRSPLLVREIEGETLLIFYSRFTEDKNGVPFVTCRLETFIRIENGGADFIARLFSSVLGKIADSNYEQTLTFVSKLSVESCISPQSVKRISRLIKNVRREVVDNFEGTADKVFERAEVRKEHFLNEHPEYVWRAKENYSELSENNLFTGSDISSPDIAADKGTGQRNRDELPPLTQKPAYIVPALPVGRSYSYSEFNFPKEMTDAEKSKETAAEETGENTASTESDEKNNTAADSDAGDLQKATSKPKSGAVFGKPKL